jgi:hypothetical protein
MHCKQAVNETFILQQLVHHLQSLDELGFVVQEFVNDKVE